RTPRGTILSPTPPLQSTPGPSEWPAARSRPRGWGASAPQPPRRAEENDHAAGNAPGARRYPLCWHGSSGVGARGGREARRPGELERLLQAPSTGSKVKRVVRATSARRPGPRAAGGAGLGRLLRARGLGAGTTQGAGAVAAIEGARALPLPAAGVMPATAAGAGRGAAVGDTHQSEKRGAARGSEERSCRWERAVEGGGEGGQDQDQDQGKAAGGLSQTVERLKHSADRLGERRRWRGRRRRRRRRSHRWITARRRGRRPGRSGRKDRRRRKPLEWCCSHCGHRPQGAAIILSCAGTVMSGSDSGCGEGAPNITFPQHAQAGMPSRLPPNGGHVQALMQHKNLLFE
ncbi:unnamed protein product, partial [Prorocentrum cordatum]